MQLCGAGNATGCFDQKSYKNVASLSAGNGMLVHGVAEEIVNAVAAICKSYNKTVHWS